MSGAHAHALYREADSPLHRLPAQCKIVSALLFVVAVVATPREAFAAYAGYATIIVVLAGLGKVPPTFLARRLVIEIPFILFALFLPIVGRGARTDVLGLSLSVDGLWAAWNILAKATIGLSVTVILASTTPIADLLRGLERLHMPRLITVVMGFMIRYLDVIAGEVQRMRVARISRGHDPRWIWQARAIASTAGALFIRSFERGERVYLAMVSRGYEGTLPHGEAEAASPGEWLAAAVLPALGLVVAGAAWAARP
jgi:cobalt/nickel transport system permease protein